MIHDARACDLGEGPLWHPLRNQLFWFDITGQRLLSQVDGSPCEWRFDGMVSAAGWISRDELLIAGERGLVRFNLDSAAVTPILPLEAETPLTRSNDGRADPQGGFWIGTMGKTAQPGAGAIYRFYRGELRRLYDRITIPNAICFAPDGRTAHFADTVTKRVMRVALDAQGWPQGAPQVFLDLGSDPSGPDGAVVDAQGLLWLAQWGAGRVSAFAPDGSLVRHVGFAAPHTSCPAFGGDTLYCTSALQGMDAAARTRWPDAGRTFMARGIAFGQIEHQVIL